MFRPTPHTNPAKVMSAAAARHVLNSENEHETFVQEIRIQEIRIH
jgi:hypothetical protein